MKRFIFDIVTSQYALFENPMYNYVAMGIIGYIAYKLAFSAVGELGFRGELGSDAHLILRFIFFVGIWAIGSICIVAFKIIVDNFILILICEFLIFVFYILWDYASEHPNCFLNKRVF